MVERKRLKEEVGGQYFENPQPGVKLLTSGCTLLDLALGGGYPLGRIVNIVGDKSTGKTLLAIEAAINFVNKYPKGRVWYAEVESAFDEKYAEALGLPVDKIEFMDDIFTVEDWFEDLDALLKEDRKTKNKEPGLYIIDSLDALSSRAELGRAIDEGTYGAEKAKQMSQLFRRLIQQIEESQICVIVISQVRDNIGVMIGDKYSRSGGRALDFYASQVLFLAHIKTLKRTISKQDRAYGIEIKAKVKKNKIGLPFREVQFPIYFGYGVEDLRANLEWLKGAESLDLVDLSQNELTKLYKTMDEMSDSEYASLNKKAVASVKLKWREIESQFIQKRRKYR